MPNEDELAAALQAFEEAGRALLAALKDDAPDVSARLAAARARLVRAQQALDAVQKRQARD